MFAYARTRVAATPLPLNCQQLVARRQQTRLVPAAVTCAPMRFPQVELSAAPLLRECGEKNHASSLTYLLTPSEGCDGVNHQTLPSTEQTFRAARRPSLYRHGHARFKRTGSGHGELQRPIRAGCTRCTSRPILVWWYGVVSCIIMPRLPRCIYAEATHSSYVLRTKLHDRDRGHEGLSIYQRNAAWTLAKVLR